MSRQIQALAALLMLIGVCFSSALAQEIPCEKIKIPFSGNSQKSEEFFPKNSRIIDARPNPTNAVMGKSEFGKRAQVFIINMNPFLNSKGYEIKVEQDEIPDTAVITFLKLLTPLTGALTEKGAGQESSINNSSEKNAAVDANHAKLDIIIKRLEEKPAFLETCGKDTKRFSPLCRALTLLIEQKGELLKEKDTINGIWNNVLLKEISESEEKIGASNETLLDPDIESRPLCIAAQDFISSMNVRKTRLMGVLSKAVENSGVELREKVEYEQKRLNIFDTKIEEFQSLVKRVKDSLGKNDNAVKEFVIPEDSDLSGSSGFNYLSDLETFGVNIKAIVTGYKAQAQRLDDVVKQIDASKYLKDKLVDNLDNQNASLFQRELAIEKKFEYSKVKISVKPLGAKEDTTASNGKGKSNTPNAPVGNTPSDGSNGASSGSNPASPPNEGSIRANGPQESFANGEISNGNFREADKNDNKDDKTDKPEKPVASTGRVDTFPMGSPRFALSVGMAYSPLKRQAFTPVPGIARDEAGNPTNGTAITSIAGFNENSGQRFLPIALLHTRLTNNPRNNLYFSLGITASNDSGLDIEYLFGPSIGLLNDRLFITAGAYAGKQQTLVNELYLGAGLPNGATDKSLFRERYVWKPGISISYRLLPLGKGKKEAAAVSEETGRSDEFRIGSIPFSLALGLGYSFLERTEYKNTIGYARDRQGVLTNGETFTNIIGLNERSRRQLKPLALLHTRLISFTQQEDISLYFSLGITAARKDSKTYVEYLVGPSIDLFRRKVFLTFGGYMGKQERLVSDLYVGATFPSQTNIVQTEYRWRPGFAFSYNFTGFLKE